MASSPKILCGSGKEECLEVVRALKEEAVLAVDCEGIQLGRHGPLTLLQIGTQSGDVFLFDVMKNENEQDRSFFTETDLDELLMSSNIVKVFHSCKEDSAALYHQFGIKLENVFDTQMAHIVIEEHKGKTLPPREKLEQICKIYSTGAHVYEGKDEVHHKFVKNDGKFWAKRPLTQEMIDYASKDVTALIPEVYDNQKRYLEENMLLDEFSVRVEEEVGAEIDPMLKERRDCRRTKIMETILAEMSEKYHKRTRLSDLTSDEKVALQGTSLYDITCADYPGEVRELKLESLSEFLKRLESEMRSPDNFNPKTHMLFHLNEIMFQGSKAMKKDGERVKAQFIKIVTADIEKKYDAGTPISHLSGVEYRTLANFRPLIDETKYTATILALHWQIIAVDLDENLEKLASDPEYEVQNVRRLIRFIWDVRVPEFIKSKAKDVRQANEDAIIERLPIKYDLDSDVDELTIAEKSVLDRLDVIHNSYDPVVLYLHWEVTHSTVCKEYEDFKTGKLPKKDYMAKKLTFLSTNEHVPVKTKQKAEEFLQEMSQRSGRKQKHVK